MELKEAFNAYKMIGERHKNHTNKFDINKHPIFIKESIKNLNENQFGFNLWSKRKKFLSKSKILLKAEQN